MDVGPEQESPAAAHDGEGAPAEAAGGKDHRHAMEFSQLQAMGRFVRDSRVGGMFHAGKVSLREDSPRESLHMSIGQDNRVSVHLDRFSPLARAKPGRRRAYSVGRVLLHNVGIAVDYVVLFFYRRFGEQRCELECELVCDDDHDEDGVPSPASPAGAMNEDGSPSVSAAQASEEHLPDA